MWLTSIVALLACVQSPAQGLSTKQIDALVARFLAADARTADGFAEQMRLLAELESVPPLDARQEKTWREKLLKSTAKHGAVIEREAGRQWLWPAADKSADGRGLFIVGGNTTKPKGLLVGMHGGGVGSGDAGSAFDTLASVGANHDWLVVCPEVLEKTERGWTDSGSEEFVVELVERALRTWKIDRDRVYFSGHSMGGYGSWVLGAHHADLVAGLAPSAGAPTPIFDREGVARDIDWGVVPNLRNVRLRIYQSDNDPNVPPDANRIAVKKLAEARERWGGFDYEYWEVPGRAHDLPPGGMEALVAKIADARRTARPAKVVWQNSLVWKRQFYWLSWDVPTRRAIVEADLDPAKNEVRVKCDQDPRGLAVLLDDELLDLDKEVVVLLGDKVVFRGKPQRTLATLVRTALRDDAQLMFSARIPLVP